MAAKKKARSYNKKSRRGASLKKRWGFSLRQLVIFALIFGVIGGAYLVISWAFGNGNQPPKPFVEDRARGLHWDGLRPGTGACVKEYEIVDQHGQPQGCTHGPDPAPAGVDATQSVEPLTTVSGSTVSSTNGIICDGDGVTGYRIQMIYAHASDRADRFSLFNSSFKQYASNLNNIFVESGNQSGSPRSLRYVTDASCNLSVLDVTLSPTGDDNFSNTVGELKSKGYNRSDRKYVIWADSTIYCGISGLYIDSRPTQDNPNNSGPSYGRIDSGCWGGKAEAHELMHELGGVQNDAPHSSGGMHCNDGYDRMCYADGGSTSHYTTTACPYAADDSHFDCGKNDYFSTSSSIPATNYLANHWNAANSRFLLATAPAPVSPPPPPTADTTKPIVVISAPADGSFLGSTVRITASATDNVGVTKMTVYTDGYLRTTVYVSSVDVTYGTSSVSKGQHSITVKAYDAAGNIGQTTIFVYK